jgi:hypothetical protein
MARRRAELEVMCSAQGGMPAAHRCRQNFDTRRKDAVAKPGEGQQFAIIVFSFLFGMQRKNLHVGVACGDEICTRLR